MNFEPYLEKAKNLNDAASYEILQSLQKEGLPTRKSEEWKYFSPSFLEKFENFELKNTTEWKKSESHLRAHISVNEKTYSGVQIAKTLTSQGRESKSSGFIRRFVSGLSFGTVSFVMDSETTDLDLNFSAEKAFQVLGAIEIQVPEKQKVRVHIKADEYFEELVSSVFFKLERGAELEVYAVEVNPTDGKSIQSLRVDLSEESEFRYVSVLAGASSKRNNLEVNLNGSQARCSLFALSISGKNEKLDNHFFINHNAPSCESRIVYKALVSGQAQVVYDGKVYVEKNAQKTDSDQIARGLILSDGAELDAKPSLEVFADDVSATHGAAIGQVDRDEVFYLMSRGLSEEEASKLLAFAFINEVISQIIDKELRENTKESIEKKFGKWIQEVAHVF